MCGSYHSWRRGSAQPEIGINSRGVNKVRLREGVMGQIPQEQSLRRGLFDSLKKCSWKKAVRKAGQGREELKGT